MRFNDYWKPPKNVKDFFSPKYEKQLKAEYGKWYTAHLICTFIILFIPFFVFLSLVPNQSFEPANQTENFLGAVGGIIGLIGSLAVGIGFSNVFMALVKQYLGHIVTLVAVVGGILLDVLALFLLSMVK